MPYKVPPHPATPELKNWAAKLRINRKVYSIGRWNTYEEALDAENKVRRAIAENPDKPIAEIVPAYRPGKDYNPRLRPPHAQRKPYKASRRKKGVTYFLGWWGTAAEKKAAIELFDEWWAYDQENVEEWVVEIRLPSVDKPQVIMGNTRDKAAAQRAINRYLAENPQTN